MVHLKALVTGASGFLGRVLVEKLLARHGFVRALVRSTSRIEPLHRPGVELVIGDLADKNALVRAARGMDVVIHTAGRVEVWGTPRQFQDANIAGTRNVVEALVAARVPRLVHFSSVSVYGRQTGRLDEDTPVQKCGDLYGDSKAEAEMLVREAARRHGFALTILRPSLTYGPHDAKYIPTVAANILRGRMRVVGAGDNPCPIVYGEDVADLAVASAEREEAAGQTFNVSSGEDVTWNSFLTTLAEYLGRGLPRRHLPAAPLVPAAVLLEGLWRLAGARRPPPLTRFGVWLLSAHCRYDCTRAARLLGFQPRIGYREGLRRTIAWMKQENLPLPGAETSLRSS